MKFLEIICVFWLCGVCLLIGEQNGIKKEKNKCEQCCPCQEVTHHAEKQHLYLMNDKDVAVCDSLK